MGKREEEEAEEESVPWIWIGLWFKGKRKEWKRVP